MLTEIKGYLYAAGAVLVLALIIGAGVGGYVKGVHKIELQDAPKFAVIAQAAKDQQAATDKTNIANNYVTKDAYAQLQTQLAGYSSNIDDLTQRLHDSAAAGKPVIVSGPMVAAVQCTDAGTTRITEASNPITVGSAPVEGSTLPTEVLRDDLTLALQNVEALEVVLDAAARVQR